MMFKGPYIAGVEYKSDVPPVVQKLQKMRNKLPDRQDNSYRKRGRKWVVPELEDWL